MYPLYDFDNNNNNVCDTFSLL